MQSRYLSKNHKLNSLYLDMLDDWKLTSDGLVPFPLKYDTSDFPEFINKCNKFTREKDKGFVHHSTFWLLDKGKIIGASNIRHYLNESLLEEGGHIGYGIRSSFRRMGYATELLALSLQKAKGLGIKKALLTCDKDNIASSKTIEKNGGVLWKEHKYKGKDTLNFWIEIN